MGCGETATATPAFRKDRRLVMRAGITTPSHTLPHLQTQLNPRTYLIVIPKLAHILHNQHTKHNGFTRTLDAGPPPGYQHLLYSRLEPSQLPELGTLARSTRWSHACSQACGRFPWRVCLCLSFSCHLSTFWLLSLPLANRPLSIFDFGCRVHMMLTREQYPWIPLWSRAQRRSSVLLCH
jgi:hypothetical protein